MTLKEYKIQKMKRSYNFLESKLKRYWILIAKD